MIKAIVAHGMALVRGVLTFVLSTEHDIEVVDELDRAEDVAPSVLAKKPDVAVVDLDLVRPTNVRALQALNGCRVLVLADPRRSSTLMQLMAQQHAAPIAFVAHDGPPERLVEAVRRVANGERVIDPELVIAALHTQCPLTPREIDVLAVTAEGASVKEVATRLTLAPGTVRNHLSRILAKISARNRVQAVRIAQDSGWI